MTSSEGQRRSEEDKPFHSRDGEAGQPRPQCCGRSYLCRPLPVPGAGFRNGNLYFPWSLVPRKYLDFLVPQSPLPTTANQRPDFWHYRGHGEKMSKKGTQTKLQRLWHNKISQSSCGSRGVVYNPRGGQDPSLEKMCEEEVEEMDSCPQGHMPSAARLAQSNKMSKAIQCDMSWLEDAELERSPASSPGRRKGTGEESVLCDILGRQEVGEQDSRPSTAQLAQSNKIDGAIHCDRGRVEDAELESSPEQMPSVSEESPNCTATGPREMPGSRKLNEARTAFLQGRNDTATLTKEMTSLNISDESELEDEASEIEWLFEEEVSGPSSKERLDQEESWGSYFCSLLVWPWSSKINKKNTECEGISMSRLSSARRRAVRYATTSL